MRFLFIRHGETDWNVRGVMQGSNDIPLNQNGIDQAFAAASRLKALPVTKIITSPQIRARRTAEIISDAFALAIHLEHDLRERSFGSYEGSTPDNLPKIPVNSNSPHGPFDYADGNVEPFAEVTQRSRGAIERWLDGHDHTKDGLVLFVAHGGVFSAIHHAFDCGPHFRVQNATPYEFLRQTDGKWLCTPV